MNTKTKLIILLIALGVLVTAFFAFSGMDTVSLPQGEDETATVSRTEILELILEDHDGNHIHLKEIESELILLNSWASWCPFCVNELPDFAEAQEKYADRVTIVAINRGESTNRAKTYVNNLGLQDKLTFLLDPSDSFYKSIGGFSMPETLFIKDGQLVEHRRGPITLSDISNRIEEILEE